MEAAPMKVLAVIPARGGSKGVPRKNLRVVRGKPLLVWSIEAAAPPCCRSVDRVAVSTDDPEISATAAAAGADVIQRPDFLASDTATTDGVLVHAVRHLAGEGYAADLVVLLQPTVPVRAPGLVDACVRRLLDTDANSLLTAHRLHFVWWRADRGEWAEYADWRTNSPGRPRRQEMNPSEIYWHEDGSVYVTRGELLLEKRRRLVAPVQVYETPRTVDIDTEDDLRLADALLAPRLPAMGYRAPMDRQARQYVAK